MRPGRSAQNPPAWYGRRARSCASRAPPQARAPCRRWVRCGRWPGSTAASPCSYLLDRAVNFVPEPMEFGYERELGQHALSFTCQDPYGRVMELVMMRDGGGFDLLGGF